jgi:hypothetical protein
MITFVAYEDKLDKTGPCIKQCRYLELRYEVLEKYVDTAVPIPLSFIATIL